MVNKDEYYQHVLCAWIITATPLVTRDFLWVLGTRQHPKAPEKVEVEDSNQQLETLFLANRLLPEGWKWGQRQMLGVGKSHKWECRGLPLHHCVPIRGPHTLGGGCSATAINCKEKISLMEGYETIVKISLCYVTLFYFIRKYRYQGKKLNNARIQNPLYVYNIIY